jgi:hypothetical protein
MVTALTFLKHAIKAEARNECSRGLLYLIDYLSLAKLLQVQLALKLGD